MIQRSNRGPDFNFRRPVGTHAGKPRRSSPRTVRAILAAAGGWLVTLSSLAATTPGPATTTPLDFTVKVETVMTHDDGKFLWFHPRTAVVPGRSQQAPTVVMTVQKHLRISDYYSGLHVMTRAGFDGPWTGPVLPPPLDWKVQEDGVTVSVADVTPGWHAPTGRLIALGCRVRYSPKGKQLEDIKRSHQTVYAVLNPETGVWSHWQLLELPADEHFDFARNACSQWLVQADGRLLVPLYIGRSTRTPFSTTVAECDFDGTTLRYRRHGNILSLEVKRGLYEPSLVRFAERYFLTLRNDERGYVTTSDDGLNFAPPQPWLFDDGQELGSYNTQQHWLVHSHGLFLVYTRRGANNDHIMRNRAPLFMARVDPQTLRVLRSTEKPIVPERGADLGNFGASTINAHESWVTVSEGVFTPAAKERGATEATFVARILWSQPNELAK